MKTNLFFDFCNTNVYFSNPCERSIQGINEILYYSTIIIFNGTYLDFSPRKTSNRSF